MQFEEPLKELLDGSGTNFVVDEFVTTESEYFISGKTKVSISANHLCI